MECARGAGLPQMGWAMTSMACMHTCPHSMPCMARPHDPATHNSKAKCGIYPPCHLSSPCQPNHHPYPHVQWAIDELDQERAALPAAGRLRSAPRLPEQRQAGKTDLKVGLVVFELVVQTRAFTPEQIRTHIRRRPAPAYRSCNAPTRGVTWVYA